MLYNTGMIERYVRRAGKKDGLDKTASAAKSDVAYWLSKSPKDRLSAVEFLRRQYYGSSSAGLRRVISVTKRT